MKKKAAVALVIFVLFAVSMQVASAEEPQYNTVVHIVRWGENLTSISRRYGVSIYAIVQANGLSNPNRIYAGQRLLIPTGGTQPGVPPSSGCQRYKVRPGDTLSGIALRFGVSINSIVQANNLVNPHRIYAGQVLCIPGGSPPVAVPPIHQPQPPVAVPPIAPPEHCQALYVVRRGDTLAKIGVRYGVSVWALVQANNIPNPNLIYPGQVLCIPKDSCPPGVTPTPTPTCTPPAVSGPIKPGCEHLHWPREGATLYGVVQAYGTADHPSFGYYKLEFRRDGLDDWHYVTGQEHPVHNGPLGQWNTWTVPDGPYTFRLVIVDRTGNYPPPCELSVEVKNH